MNTTSRIVTTNLMTKRDVSAATGISIPTITKGIERGELPAVFQGGRYSILPADVLRYAELMQRRNSSRQYPMSWTEKHLELFHGYRAGES